MSPPPAPAYVIVLTGGIASGKSTVQKLFEAVGAPVLDADAISRELVAPGSPALREIVAAFGADALTAHGELDRQRMRERIFADAAARRTLEQILHPRVRAELFSRARACTADYCLLAIPLMAESASAYTWVDRVLVVDVPRATQRARLMLRDGMTEDLAERALAAQASRAERLALADDIIDNTGPPANLSAVVTRLHARYTKVARTRAVAAVSQSS